MRLRPLATAAAVIALAAPLTSCGFDYATERDYTPGRGANTREGEVDVLSAVVVSAANGVTDMLLDAAKAAERGDREAFLDAARRFETRHYELIDGVDEHAAEVLVGEPLAGRALQELAHRTLVRVEAGTVDRFQVAQQGRHRREPIAVDVAAGRNA